MPETRLWIGDKTVTRYTRSVVMRQDVQGLKLVIPSPALPLSQKAFRARWSGCIRTGLGKRAISSCWRSNISHRYPILKIYGTIAEVQLSPGWRAERINPAVHPAGRAEAEEWPMQGGRV